MRLLILATAILMSSTLTPESASSASNKSKDFIAKTAVLALAERNPLSCSAARGSRDEMDLNLKSILTAIGKATSVKIWNHSRRPAIQFKHKQSPSRSIDVIAFMTPDRDRLISMGARLNLRTVVIRNVGTMANPTYESISKQEVVASVHCD